MPLTEKGEKIKSNMEEQYGPEKGERVFYASKNKGTITGVDDDATWSAPAHLPATPNLSGFAHHSADAVGAPAQAQQDPMALPAQTPAEQLHDAETALDWLTREHQRMQDDRYWRDAIDDQNRIVADLRGRIRKEADEALGRKRFGVGDGFEAVTPDDGMDALRTQEGLQRVSAECDKIAQRLDACDAQIRGGAGGNVQVR